MPRKGHVTTREKMPDLKYNDFLVQRLISCVMLDGKKSTATRIVYGAFGVIEERLKDDPLKAFHKAIENIRPEIEVKARRVGGATYQVPMEVEPDRKLTLAIRWILGATRSRAGKSFAEKLSAEILDAANNQGSAIKKKEETHKMAEANRAFSHFRF